MSNILLKLENINKYFIQDGNKIDVLHQINLQIKASELVSITGPSGSGKTTLLQIAGLLDSAQIGKVIIDDVEIVMKNGQFTNLQQKEIDQIHRKQIGFIYQEHHLLPEFSVIENVAMPLLIGGDNYNNAMLKAKEIITKIGLEAYLNYQPNKLSGGQQQRISIARALVHQPKIILADEPTGNLDSQNAENIFILLQNLVKENNIACLMVTHNQDLAKRTDRQIKISDGRIL